MTGAAKDGRRSVMIRVDQEVYDRVVRRAGLLQGQTGRPVSMNAALRDAFGLPEPDEADERTRVELEMLDDDR